MYTSKGALRAAWEGIKDWTGKKYNKDTCIHCGKTDMTKCRYWYRHAHDKLPEGCLLTLGGP